MGQTSNNSSAGVNLPNSEGQMNQDSTLPPLCDLDMGVIESLPPDLFSEINDVYGGKLTSLMPKPKGKGADIGMWPKSSGPGGGKV